MTWRDTVLAQLFDNRCKAPMNTLLHYKNWAKRLYHAPALLSILVRAEIFRTRGAAIGRMTVIESGSIKGKVKNLSIGDNSFIGHNCHLSLHDCIAIGRNVVINEGTRILTGSHRTDSPGWELTTKAVTIQDNAWIATGSILLPGTTIGYGAIVGAGSVVRGVIPDFSIVAGNPCRVVGRRFDGDFTYMPTRNTAPFQAWLGDL